MKAYHLIIILSMFLLGIGIIFLIHRPFQPVSFPTLQPSPTPTPVSLLIPTHALSGTITSTIKMVDRIPWDSPDTFAATAGGQVIQGDEILTQKQASADLSLNEIGTISMGENTDLLFGSLLPNQIIMQQKSGDISYNAADSTHYVSIRTLGALLQFEPKFVTKISVKNPTVTISVITGTGTLGYINNANETQVWKLQSGDTATINNTTGRVKTSGVLVPAGQ